MWPNPQETADLVTFTEEILNGKPHFLCSAYSINDTFLIGCFSPIWLKKKPEFYQKNKKTHYFLKDFLTISYPNIDLSKLRAYEEKNYGPKRTSYFFWPYKINLNIYTSFFVMNGCISLKSLYKPKTQYCLHWKKNTHKNIPTKRFFLKHKNCLKSDLKYAKYRNQLGKIPRENGIKDKFFFFWKLLTKPYKHMQKSQEWLLCLMICLMIC